MCFTEVRILLLNDVSVSDTRIGHDIQKNIYKTCISKVFNSKNICWISDNFSMILIQF